MATGNYYTVALSRGADDPVAMRRSTSACTSDGVDGAAALQTRNHFQLCGLNVDFAMRASSCVLEEILRQEM